MISFVLRKLIHKKWMVFCLLLGNILLIAVAASYPLYRVSSFQRMLKDEFRAYEEESGNYPGILKLSYSTLKGGAKFGYSNMERKAEEAVEAMDVSVTDHIFLYQFSTQKSFPSIVRDDVKEKRVTLGAISDLESRIELTDGRMPDSQVTSDGFIEVIASEALMIKKDILIGDEYEYELSTLADGRPMKLRVVGIYKVLNEDDKVWSAVSSAVSENLVTTESLYKSLFFGEDREGLFSMSAAWYYIWDYEKLDISKVGKLVYTVDRLRMQEELNNRLDPGASYDILSEYMEKAKRIEATLLILQVPVLLLLSAFLYMISSQMLSMERNEISLLRSRGASKRQIVTLYLYQSIFMGLMSLIPGIPLGILFCKILGSSTAFLEFGAKRDLPIKFTSDFLFYALLMVLLSVVITTLPVLSYAGVSIVNLKQSRQRAQKSFWKKAYLDIILMAIGLYGYYSFNRNKEAMTLEVLKGESLDPLLYISFSLFILGAGLFAARIQPIFLKAFFFLTEKKLGPAAYTSLLGTIRTGAKQEFIILFTILTVSIGISDTMIARTIVSNAISNRKHAVGTEVVLKEKWTDNSAMQQQDPTVQFAYTEPDFSKYQTIKGIENLTQVVFDEKGKVGAAGLENVKVMGIKPKGFYDVTSMRRGLLPFNYEDYLNVLSKESSAVIVSENFMTKKGYKLGDIISYTNNHGDQVVGRIYGFFTYWPGYRNGVYNLNTDGTVDVLDEYMIVANFTYLEDRFGPYPYEIWMKTEDGGDGLYEWLSEQSNMKLVKFKDMTKEEVTITEDTMFQGTNGILSMSFIVILVLCAVGYLIYWIMSIRQRELLFGVLRAMGMRKGEVNKLLIIEQICSGVYAILAGAGVGILSSRMFVPMIQQAYAASEQVLPLELITDTGDMIQLFATIFAMLMICVIVLARIVSHMNISSALKLGED